MLSMALPNRPWVSSPFPDPSTPPWPSPPFPSPLHSSLALITPPWSSQLHHGPHYPTPAFSTPPWSFPPSTGPLQPSLTLLGPVETSLALSGVLSKHPVHNTPGGGRGEWLYNKTIYCYFKLINTKIPFNYIFIYDIKSAISDIHINFSTLIQLLGIFLTEYQRKYYYPDLRCKKEHFIIFISE